VTKALDMIEAEFAPTEIRDEIVDFIRNSNRGVMKGFGSGS
jgi:UDP-N-acetylglucosamine acyltransferase